MTWGLLGVPTSAGSHFAGQDKAPAAWRDAGLVQALTDRGVMVRDHGDLPVEVHRGAPKTDGIRDLDRVAAVVARVRQAVSRIAAGGERPLVLGGDCTVTLGVVSGLGADTGLIYFDGDADLSVPGDGGSGVADTMGVTHLLGGGHPRLAGPAPLLRPDHLELFGFDPAELSTAQWSAVVAQRLHATAVDAVREHPERSARAALKRLEATAHQLVLHLDVDVLDTGLFPLANFPHFSGLTLDVARRSLSTFAQSRRLAAVVVTEVNPDHDPDGTLLEVLAGVVADTIGTVPDHRQPAAP
jgi:arginase